MAVKRGNPELPIFLNSTVHRAYWVVTHINQCQLSDISANRHSNHLSSLLNLWFYTSTPCQRPRATCIGNIIINFLIKITPSLPIDSEQHLTDLSVSKMNWRVCQGDVNYATAVIPAAHRSTCTNAISSKSLLMCLGKQGRTVQGRGSLHSWRRLRWVPGSPILTGPKMLRPKIEVFLGLTWWPSG